MKTLIVMLFLSAQLGGVAVAGAPRPDHSRQEVQHVIDLFQGSVIGKDKAGLSRLFMPTHNSWIIVFAEPSYRAIKAAHPDAPRIQPGDYQDFVNFIAGSPKRMEEKFSNVRIASDGAVASVYFDFVFLVDGIANNRGSETWQMVHTDDGWKINALAYTINLDEEQRSRFLKRSKSP
ncbi:MAG: nuclear transport factor 2 family protein [Pseudomonadota bacterium]|nr:nuclear transport factor 2 family protein [Pseudomonadota bacterium]